MLGGEDNDLLAVGTAKACVVVVVDVAAESKYDKSSSSEKELTI